MRRRRPERREILPDPVFNDLVVTKFVNNLMISGKKSIAERIFYNSLKIRLSFLIRDSTNQSIRPANRGEKFD